MLRGEGEDIVIDLLLLWVEAMDKFQAENAENGVDADDIEDDGEEPPAYDPTEAVER